MDNNASSRGHYSGENKHIQIIRGGGEQKSACIPQCIKAFRKQNTGHWVGVFRKLFVNNLKKKVSINT